MQLSVIICTHNPCTTYFDKVLKALEAQTLQPDFWELLLIDNASSTLLSSKFDISWHPKSHHIREEKLGLTHARLRGIQEASSNILVFVDDDNVLHSGYLELALKISQEFLSIGAWGGQTIPEFEIDPPAWTKHYWGYLGIREFSQDYCSKFPVWEATPIGAGLCIRKMVAEKYAEQVNKDLRRTVLDRSGQLLLGCGDLDMVYTAHDLGLETGLFTNLKLLHLMPSSRLEENYLLKLFEGTAYSGIMLSFLRGQFKLDWMTRLKVKMPWLRRPKSYFLEARRQRFRKASEQGKIKAIKEILKNTDLC